MDKIHSLVLSDRRQMSLSGVSHVEKIDDRQAVIYTAAGMMTVRGRQLKPCGLNTETGDMTIEGEIDSISYGDRERKAPIGIIGRIFR
ncbi:MAG: sporulation protein YabP [Oscillospiraceae bacterium]|nr:sporulation protein YabP [Oscillospiraceae bacterium]